MKLKLTVFFFLFASVCLFADEHVFLRRDDGHSGLPSSSVAEIPEVSYDAQKLMIKTKDTKPYTIIIKDIGDSVIYSKHIAPTGTVMEIYLPTNANEDKCYIEILYFGTLLRGTFAQ